MEKGNHSKRMTKNEPKQTAGLVPISGPSGQSVNNSNNNKTTPKDAQIVTQILKDMAINEYEPRIVHQMIEFTYRYVSNVLEDAQLFSSYAKKKNIDCDDVSLAIQLQVDKGFTGPPPRDLLLDIAKTKNSQPLPTIKSHNGPRLPADRYSLISCNYKQKSLKSKPLSSQINLPYRSQMTGTSILNSSNNSSNVLKPITSITSRTGSQSLQFQLPSRSANTSNLLKTSDTSLIGSGIKRKIEDS